jgi:hypothetical protein
MKVVFPKNLNVLDVPYVVEGSWSFTARSVPFVSRVASIPTSVSRAAAVR